MNRFGGGWMGSGFTHPGKALLQEKIEKMASLILSTQNMPEGKPSSKVSFRWMLDR